MASRRFSASGVSGGKWPSAGSTIRPTRVLAVAAAFSYQCSGPAPIAAPPLGRGAAPDGTQSPVPPINLGRLPPGASIDVFGELKFVQIPWRSGSPHGVRGCDAADSPEFAALAGACPLAGSVARNISAVVTAAPPAHITFRSLMGTSIVGSLNARPPLRAQLRPIISEVLYEGRTTIEARRMA